MVRELDPGYKLSLDPAQAVPSLALLRPLKS